MEKRCIICDGRKNKKLYKLNGYSILKCSSCHFIFTYPLPTNAELQKLYNKFTYEEGFANEKLIRRDAKRILSNIKKIKHKKGTLLDMGAGAGFLLDEARKQGWKTQGIEIAPIPLAHAEKKLKLKITRKGILDFETNNKFDTIILSQVIEHFADPRPVLIKISKLLKNDGIACISTPNITSFLARVLGKDFNYLSPPNHLLYFSPTTLTKFIENSGFKLVKIHSYGYPEDAGIAYRAIKVKRTKQNSVNISDINPNVKNFISKKQKPRLTQKVRKYLFENVFRELAYRVLNVRMNGSMIEAYIQKR